MCADGYLGRKKRLNPALSIELRVVVLSPLLKPPAEAEIPKEEKDKYQEEFENFQQDLDKKKEEFQKEHPDVLGEPSESTAATPYKYIHYLENLNNIINISFISRFSPSCSTN